MFTITLQSGQLKEGLKCPISNVYYCTVTWWLGGRQSWVCTLFVCYAMTILLYFSDSYQWNCCWTLKRVVQCSAVTLSMWVMSHHNISYLDSICSYYKRQQNVTPKTFKWNPFVRSEFLKQMTITLKSSSLVIIS